MASPTVRNHYYEGRRMPDRCVVNMRSAGTDISSIVTNQYYGVPNSKGSLLRGPQVAGSLCSEHVSSPLVNIHKSKSVRSDSQKCPGAVRHQTVHERYVCVLRIVKFLDGRSFSNMTVVVQISLCSENASSEHTGFSFSCDSILRRRQP